MLLLTTVGCFMTNVVVVVSGWSTAAGCVSDGLSDCWIVSSTMDNYRPGPTSISANDHSEQLSHIWLDATYSHDGGPSVLRRVSVHSLPP
jgi:hypothetical protein